MSFGHIELLPPHLQIEPIRVASHGRPRRFSLLLTLFLEAGMGAALFWAFHPNPEPPSLPPMATFQVQLFEDSPVEAASAPTGTGTIDPSLRKPESPLIPPESSQALPDRHLDRPHLEAMNPQLPIAPGGDGREVGPDGRPDRLGSGNSRGIDSSGIGSGAHRARLGDMTILRREYPKYPEWEKLNGVEGVVELEITINEKGVPILVKILNDQELGLSNAAVKAVRLWRFEPVRKQGVAVTASFRMDFQFVIVNKPAKLKMG